MSEQKFRLTKKKIPVPEEFKICPLCNEPLTYQWTDEEMRGFLFCKNPRCEIDAVSLKNFDCFGNPSIKSSVGGK